MIVFRRRLIFWLLKAYLKKWGKVIFISFLAGLGVFFLLLAFSSWLSNIIPVERKTTIGMVGNYTLDTIPPNILSRLSEGLTTISEKGETKPGIANFWEIKKGGKEYVFHLKNNLTFTSGERVTSDLISYNFADVSVQRPDARTIIYDLKDIYSPFLVTVAKPLFIKNFVGVGDYRLTNIDLNGNFVRSLTLTSRQNRFVKEEYIFYPTARALKTAFVLGEVTMALGLDNPNFQKKSFTSFPGVKVTKSIDHNQLVTLFYNTLDARLSDKKIRSGLSYALPDTFPFGQRSYLPYPPGVWYYNDDLPPHRQDLQHAKLLFASAKSDPAKLTLTVKTLSKYKETADLIAKEWQKLGIKTKIIEVDTVPTDFQIYLGDFMLPKDPDQYTLWHSSQENNITKYDNKRIDKLLEDGRKTFDLTARKTIYNDFQKYLLDDSPASFLYFPNNFVIRR